MSHPRRPLDPLLRLGVPLIQTARTSLIGWPTAVAAYGTNLVVGVAGMVRGRRPSIRSSLARLIEGLALPLVGVAHLLIDGVAGVAGGAVFGSPLTDDEKRFATSIYGDTLPLNAIRIVETGWGYNGMAAATTIYLGQRGLADPISRATFAHELAHVFQDSRWRGCHRGTLRATWQAAQNATRFKDVYRIDFGTMTDWHRLEPESQAVMIQSWVEVKAFGRSTDPDQRGGIAYFLACRNLDVNNDSEMATLEQLLRQSGLFGGDPVAWQWDSEEVA